MHLKVTKNFRNILGFTSGTQTWKLFQSIKIRLSTCPSLYYTFLNII